MLTITCYRATDNYAFLKTCSNSIEQKCRIGEGFLDTKKLDSCNTIMTKIKEENEECSTSLDRCKCFASVAGLMESAKKEGCTDLGKKSNKAIVDAKKMCTSFFSECKRVEAAAYFDYFNATMLGAVVDPESSSTMDILAASGKANFIFRK